MSSHINCLKESVSRGKEDRIKEELSVLSSEANLHVADDAIFVTLLNFEDVEILKLCAQIIADLTKTEENRITFSKERVIKALLKLLQHSNKDVIFQSVRALGNICYENETSCEIVSDDGLRKLLAILNGNVKAPITSVASGFLVNLLAPHEPLQKAAFKYHIIDVIEKVIIENSDAIVENDFLYTNLLTVLSLLLDNMEEMNVAISKPLCSTIIEILKTSSNPEICSLCLDLLHFASEDKGLKTLIAERGVCQLIYELVAKHGNKVDDDESRTVLKSACDLIVVILTEDECMDLLYNNGEGEVYKNMLTWLKSTEEDLMTTGVLAIGNFARKDQHCLKMVESGVAKSLLDILSRYNVSDDDVKLQHALLSTLRNLAIPQKNKERLLKDGLIEILYPLMKSEEFLVIFKLLGTLRMVIDGQEQAASKLLQDNPFLTRLVYWCYNSDHLGIRGEVPRLISWLVKNCSTSAKNFSAMLDVEDCVRCIVEMISSNHAVMQNEACYSLVTLAVGFGKHEELLEKYFKQLAKADVGKHLAFTLGKYGDAMDGKTAHNVVTLVEHLVITKELMEQLRENKLDDVLEKLEKNDEVGEVRGRLKLVIREIKG